MEHNVVYCESKWQPCSESAERTSKGLYTSEGTIYCGQGCAGCSSGATAGCRQRTLSFILLLSKSTVLRCNLLVPADSIETKLKNTPYKVLLELFAARG